MGWQIPNSNLKNEQKIIENAAEIVNLKSHTTDVIDAQLKSLNDGKVDKVSGKQLSTNDYTSAEKTKLAGIAIGANNTTINNTLTSTSTTAALSAAQGKVLKDLADTKASNTDLTTLNNTVTQHMAEIAWQTANLLNGWESYAVGYEPKYAMDKHGYLLFKGAMKNGTLTKGTPLFILPENFRPTVYRNILSSCNNQSFNPYEYKTIELSIAPDGKVVLGSTIPYGQFLGMDGVVIKL